MVYSYMSGYKLFKLRRILGLTQREMAILLGIHAAQISRIEKKETAQIRILTMMKVKEVLQPLVKIVEEQGVEAARIEAHNIIRKKRHAEADNTGETCQAVELFNTTEASHDIRTSAVKKLSISDVNNIVDSQNIDTSDILDIIDDKNIDIPDISDIILGIHNIANGKNADLPVMEDIVVPMRILITRIQQLFYRIPDYLRPAYFRAFEALFNAFKEFNKTNK